MLHFSKSESFALLKPNCTEARLQLIFGRILLRLAFRDLSLPVLLEYVKLITNW